MNKKLISLRDHDSEKKFDYMESSFPRLNGIACPLCGEELYDSSSSILTSRPPQKNIHCSGKICNYKGYRVA